MQQKPKGGGKNRVGLASSRARAATLGSHTRRPPGDVTKIGEKRE
jgi:hypothetical protein